MSETTDTAWPERPTVPRRAEHARGTYDRDIAECEKVIGSGGGLQHIAHFTSGIFDFAVDAPGALDTAGSDPAVLDDLHRAFDKAGRQLNFMMVHFDAVCQPLDTGPLIRVVLQGEGGALFHYLKLPGQSLFGGTLDGSEAAVRRADRQMASVVEAAARRLGVESLNWGGFRARQNARAQAGDEAAPDVPRSAPHIWYPDPSPDPEQRSLGQLCMSALHPARLNYAAIFGPERAVVSADIFDNPALAPFFQRVTPELRRSGYADLVRHVYLQGRRILQILQTAGSRRLVRLTLDVARGAIYLMPLDDENYLVGVTLIQAQVEEADAEFRELYARIAKARG
jgi:hypothetical protein